MHQNVNYASKQAISKGASQVELLLFHLGTSGTSSRSEFFGINVLRVREIVTLPEITSTAGASRYALGIVHLRDQIIPVYDLPAIVGCQAKTEASLMLVTEYAGTTQAFTVDSVEDIVRLDQGQVTLGDGSGQSKGLVTGIATLSTEEEGTRLVQLLDLEAVLDKVKPSGEATAQGVGTPPLSVALKPDQVVLAADDSYVARALLEQTLQSLGIRFVITKSGREAWETLNSLADKARQAGGSIQDQVALVLTDLEMPEMDGLTLTQNIRQDPRFASLPVIIHSSLSGSTTVEHARKAGADGFVTKFSTEELIQTVTRVLAAKHTVLPTEE